MCNKTHYIDVCKDSKESVIKLSKSLKHDG